MLAWTNKLTLFILFSPHYWEQLAPVTELQSSLKAVCGKFTKKNFFFVCFFAPVKTSLPYFSPASRAMFVIC